MMLLYETHVPLQFTLHCNRKLTGVRFSFRLPFPLFLTHASPTGQGLCFHRGEMPDTQHDTWTTEGRLSVCGRNESGTCPLSGLCLSQTVLRWDNRPCSPLPPD